MYAPPSYVKGFLAFLVLASLSYAASTAELLDAVIAENPELKVRLAESGEVMTAGEAMARARSEAQHDLGERDLVRAAVQCALPFGV